MHRYFLRIWLGLDSVIFIGSIRITHTYTHTSAFTPSQFCFCKRLKLYTALVHSRSYGSGFAHEVKSVLSFTLTIVRINIQRCTNEVCKLIHKAIVHIVTFAFVTYIYKTIHIHHLCATNALTDKQTH